MLHTGWGIQDCSAGDRLHIAGMRMRRFGGVFQNANGKRQLQTKIKKVHYLRSRPGWPTILRGET